MQIIHYIKFLAVLALVINVSSCATLVIPSHYKITRGNWEAKSSVLEFNQLPKQVQDTLVGVYKNYYDNDPCTFVPELVSLEPLVQMCFLDYYTFSQITYPIGYYFSIGRKKCFIDYSELMTPIVYYHGLLFFPTGDFYAGPDRNQRIRESKYDDTENRTFVQVKLDDRYKRKFELPPKHHCIPRSTYSFVKTKFGTIPNK